MEENDKQPKGCPQDCLKCNFQQHAYCAAQMALNSFPSFDAILTKLNELQTVVAELKSSGTLSIPEPKKAQRKGGGADNRPPELNEPKEEKL